MHDRKRGDRRTLGLRGLLVAVGQDVVEPHQIRRGHDALVAPHDLQEVSLGLAPGLILPGVEKVEGRGDELPQEGLLELVREELGLVIAELEQTSESVRTQVLDIPHPLEDLGRAVESLDAPLDLVEKHVPQAIHLPVGVDGVIGAGRLRESVHLGNPSVGWFMKDRELVLSLFKKYHL